MQLDSSITVAGTNPTYIYIQLDFNVVSSLGTYSGISSLKNWPVNISSNAFLNTKY